MTSQPIRRILRSSAAMLAACLVLASPLTVLAQSQVEKSKTAKPSTKDLIRQGIEAANNEDFKAAAGFLDEALKLSPTDRPALFIASVIASVGADRVQSEAEKVTMLRRSSATFARLREHYKTLTPDESSFAQKVQLDDARVLAIEKKTRPALELVLKLLESGYSDFDAIEAQDDFKLVREQPEYVEKMEKIVKADVQATLAKNESFPFDFTLDDVNGKTVKLAEYKGKVTIVDVWGTWCPPCRKEIPHFVDLEAKYGPKGLKIVGINCNEEGSPAEVKKTIKEFIAANKISYPCVINDEKTESKIPGFRGYPTTLFLDEAGKVRLALVGYNPMVRLEAIVSALLAESTK